MDVAYFPTEPGEYAVHVLCNQDDIPKSPYMADIKPAPAGFDPSKVHNPNPNPSRHQQASTPARYVTLTLTLAGTSRLRPQQGTQP